MKPELADALKLLAHEPQNQEALAALAKAAEGAGDGTGDPATERAVSEARRLHRERGDFELVVRLCDLELSWQKESSRRGELLLDKGRVLLDELLDERAAEEAWRAALEATPGDERVEEALAQLALVREKWPKIVGKYVAEAEGASEKSLQAGLYVSAAELLWKHEPGARTVEEHLGKALQIDPKNRKAAALLERLLRASDRFDELARLLAQRSQLAWLPRDDKSATLLSLADLQRERLHQPAEALATLEKVLAIDAANAHAVLVVGDELSNEGDWLALVKLYEAALKARRGDSGEVRQLLVRLGTVLFDKLGQGEAAELHFARVRKGDPANRAMLDFYRAYLGERGEGAKLLQVLGQAQKAEGDPRRKLELGVEMAHLAEAQANNPDKAIEIWKGILRADTSSGGASGEAQAALKRLYRGAQKWNALLEVLKEELEQVALPVEAGAEHEAAIARRIELLLEIVAIYRDRLSLDAMIINTYNAILALRPEHEGALAALAAKFEQLGRWNDLINTLQRTADHCDDPVRKAALLRRIAGLWLEKFSNQNQAVKPLEELYALGPSDPETAEQLRTIYTRRRSWKQLLDLERREVGALRKPAQREKLVEMARLSAEKLGDPREAIGFWNQVLELDAHDGEALAALASLYDREKRFPALVEVLRRQQATVKDLRQKVQLLERIGLLASEKLQAAAIAIEAYRGILALQPNHARASRLLRELLVASGDLAGLEALYGDPGQFEELCETLLQVADRTADPPRRTAILVQVAEVAEQKLRAPERAARAYERILDAEGTAPAELRRAAEALVGLYRRLERWPRLLVAFETLLTHATGDDERFTLYRQMGHLCEDKLGSKQQAFAWQAKAYRLRPDVDALEGEVLRLGAEADSYEAMARLLGEQIERSEGERRLARLLLLGDIVLNTLGRPEEARRCFEQVLAALPGDAHSLEALERIHAQAGNHVELLAVYRHRLEHTRGAEARVELLFKIAWIEEEQTGELDAAAATYERVLEEEAQSQRALRALERIYRVRGRHGDLARTLARQIELVEDPAQEVELACRLGDLHRGELREPREALPWYERAFARDAAHAPTIAALEGYLADGNEARVHVARLLEPVYARSEEPEKQVRAREILLAAAAGNPDEELGHLQTLVRLTGRRLGDAEAAYRYAARILPLTPGDVSARAELAELAEVIGGETEVDHARRLAAVEERVAAGTSQSDRALARDLAWELGGRYAERLKRPLEAEQAWLRVLERDPDHARALQALQRLYQEGARHRDLRALLSRRLELPLSDAARRDLLLRIAEIDETLLDDPEAAIRSYQRILEMDPARPAGSSAAQAFTALDRLLIKRKEWPRLDQLYADSVASLGDAKERADLTVQRAQLRLERLGDAHAACDLFEEALAQVPAQEAARAGLEKLLDQPGLRQRVARRLEPLYVEEGSWERLIVVLLAQREQAAPHDAVALLARVAGIAEGRLQDPARAFQTWREAFTVEPGNPEVQANLERLATALDRYRELAEAWEEGEGIADRHDLALRRRFLESAARLYEAVVLDAARAKAVWRRLLELDPANQESAQPAAEALGRIYQAEESWPDLIGILRRQAAWAKGAAGSGLDRKRLLQQAAAIEEDLIGDPGAAIGTHREILELDPAETASLDALERLHTLAGQWQELVGTLRRRLDLASDPALRRALLWRIAELTETKLVAPGEPPDAAIRAYEALLEVSARAGAIGQADHLPAFEALSRLHERAGRHADLHEVLERRLQLAADGPLAERQGLRARLAELLVGPLASPARALDRYREMLDEDRGDETARAGLERLLDHEDLRLKAAEVLELVYRERGETDQIVRLCELWAEHSPDRRDRIARLRMIARLRREGGDPRAAFHAQARAVRLGAAEPEIGEMLDDIEGIVEELPGELGVRLIGLYREISRDILDPQVQERTFLVVAARARALGDTATARDYYRRVLEGQPEHPVALDALERIYRDGGEHLPLLQIFTRRAELEPDDDRRQKYLMQAAALCEGPLGRVDDAVSFYQQVLELQPADRAAARRLEGLFEGADRFAELAELIERRLGFADDISDAVALHVRLGELYDKDLGDRFRAVDHYRSALSGDPDHAGAVAALERFLGDPDLRVEAAEVLEPVYTARADFASVVRICQIRLDATDDSARRLQLTRRIALLHEEMLDDLDGAFTWHGRLFREAPEDRAIREQLLRLANVVGAHARLAEVFEDYLKDVYEETPASIEVLRTLAEVYDAKLGDLERAKACYLRLIKHDPNDLAAFEQLEDLLTRGARWAELARVYREVGDNSADEKRRIGLLYKIGDLRRSQLGDADGAIEVFREIHALDAGDRRAAGALDELLTAGERWHELVEHLNGQLDVDPAAREALKLRLGQIHHDKLGDAAAAVDHYEEVLGLGAGNEEAIAALERLLGEVDVRPRVASILEPIYRARSDWQRLVGVYQAQLDTMEDRPRRVEVLREIARLYEERDGNLTLAFDWLARAWAEEAGEGQDREEPLYLQLHELAAQIDSWAELLATLGRGVDATYDDELRARLHERIGAIREERTHDLAGAIASWRKVAAIHPEAATAWQALERLLERGERPAELIEVFERRASLSSDPVEQKGLYGRAAELHERALGDRERAIAAWKQVLALDEDDRQALGALRRLLSETGQARELASVLSRQVHLAEVAPERRELRFEMARAHEAAGDVLDAVSAWRAALDEDGRDREAIDALVRLHEKEQQWPELLEMLDTAASVVDAGAERNALRFRAAQVLDVEQRDPLAAVERYREILDEDPAHPAARKALQGLLDSDEARGAAAAVLESLHRRTGEHRPLVAVLEVKLAAGGADDPGERRTLLADIAALEETGLADPAAAFSTWGRLLAGDPADTDALAQLERLAGQLGNWQQLSALVAAQLDEVYDPDLQRTLALELASLAEERLGEPARAVQWYFRALESPGEELPALRALDRLLSRDQERHGRELAEVLEREAAAVEDAGAQAELWYRLGELRRARLGDAAGAIAAWRETIDRKPDHVGARQALERMVAEPQHAQVVLDLLEPLYEAGSEHGRRVWIGEARLALAGDPEERAALLSRIAEIEENDLGDAAGALDAAARALAEAPGDLSRADEVERLGAKAGRLRDAAEAMERVLGRVHDEVGRDIGLRSARLFAELGDEPRAVERYRAVLELDPENTDALGALERVYRAQGRPAELAEVLARRALGVEDIVQRKAVLAEVATLRAGPLDDEAGAIAAWKQVLEADETDAAALAALAGIHGRAGRERQLIEVLDQQARFATDVADQAALRTRTAGIYASLGDVERAIEAWRDVLDLAPDSLPALAALEELLTRRGDQAAVQDVLLQQLGVAGEGAAQVPIYRRLAALANGLGRGDEAVSYLQSILELVPGDEQAHAQLESALAAQERWVDLVEALRGHARVEADAGRPEQEVELWLRAAALLDEKLGDSIGAGEMLEAVLARQPANLRVLDSLARLYESAHDLERCREVLARAASRGGTGPDAAQIEFRLGRLAEEMGAQEVGAQETAAHHYARALELSPGHAPALEALEKEARAREDWPAVAALLAQRVEHGDAEAKRAALRELARLHGEQLGRPGDALPFLEQALALAPGDAAILEPLAAAYESAGRLDAALPLYLGLIESTMAAHKGRRTRELAHLHFRAGGIAEGLHDSARASEQYHAAQAIDAGHVPTLAALGRLYVAAGEWEKARRIYRSLLLQNLDGQTGVRKADVYLALGEIHEKTNEGHKAAGMYERALDLEPGSEPLKQALARVKPAR